MDGSVHWFATSAAEGVIVAMRPTLNEAKANLIDIHAAPVTVTLAMEVKRR